MIAATSASPIEGYEAVAFKSIAQASAFDELLKHAESLGVNAILSTFYDDALDVDTPFHCTAVVIGPVPLTLQHLAAGPPSYVIIDLKMESLKPEFRVKMNFYLSAVDDLLRHRSDQPSIRIILCKSTNKILAEYALRDLRKPMRISEYRLTESLPKQLKSSLSSVRQLEDELKGQEQS